MNGPLNFADRSKHRRIIRAAIVHIIVAWLFVQIADVVLPYLGVVDEPVRWALIVSVASFPITLFIAWLSDNGSHIPELLVVLGIGAVAALWVASNIPKQAYQRTSLVVLPFDYGNDPSLEGLSRALAQEVGSLLMKSRSVDVISDESARSPLLQGLGTVAIADRLRVGAVLAGSVAAHGTEMRIDLQLLSSAGDVLWESIIEDNMGRLFAVQERIATEVERRLGENGDTVPVAEVAAQRCWMPADASALRRYYTARHYIEARTETDVSRQQIAEAIAIYKDLIEQYPEFAEARAGLAWAYEYQFTYDRANAVERVHEVSAATAARALEDCPTLGEAMHLVQQPSRYDNHWTSEWETLTRVIELEPHKPENYQRLARHYRETGLLVEAREVAERLVAMNPLSVRAMRELASIYMEYELFEESKALYERSRELGNTGPNWAMATEKMETCRKRGDVECLLENLHDVHKPFKDQLRIVYRTPATEAEARESVEAAVQVFEADPRIFTNWLNAAACEWDHLTPLFFEIWRGSRERGSYWFWPNAWIDECVDVWSDPRFPELVEDEGLVEYWREVGWPEACRPQGESFACGRNIVREPM